MPYKQIGPATNASRDAVAELMDARGVPDPRHVVATLNAQAVENGLGVAAFAMRL